jgi:2-amino-4-hydroxy-6-hydroxymethyldihydropteridine diphosphokinase
VAGVFSSKKNYIPVMVEVAVSLGSNSGDRWWYLEQMELLLQEVLKPPFASSHIMETEPVEVTTLQPWYLNRIISGYFDQDPFTLLREFNCIETRLGRKNKGTRTERTADIDILLFGTEVIRTSTLTIPHPAVHSRRYCLEGLDQIMPDMVIATIHTTVHEYYLAMMEQLGIQRIRFPRPGEETNGK